MKNVIRIILAATLVLAFSATAVEAKQQKEVPLRAVVSGVDTIDLEATGCPEGTSWRYTSEGTGNVSHLGRVSHVVTHCTTFNPAQLGGTFGFGTITFTAANGDTLVIAQRGTFQVDAAFTESTIQIYWDVVGGTGRFYEATGSGTGTGVGDIAAGTADFRLDGVIAYDASNRSR